MLFVIFLIEFVLLFFSSRWLTNSLFRLIFYLSKSRSLAVYFFALLFMPGVLIHELSHFLSAIILFVPVGEIELMPKVTGDSIKLGSVQIRETGIVRRSIIGIAPTIVGMFLIVGIPFYFMFYNQPVNFSLLKTFLILYFIFEIGNTLFSSRKDLEGVVEFFAVILFIVGVLYFSGTLSSVPVENLFSSRVTEFMKMMDVFLFVPIILNVLVYLVSEGMWRVVGKN